MMKSIKASLKIFTWLTGKMPQRSKFLICVASGVSMAGGFVMSLIPKTIGSLLDSYTKQHAVVLSMILLALLYLVSETSNVVRRLIVESIATNFARRLTYEAAKKILHLDMDFIQQQRSGGLNSKVQSSVAGAVKLVKLFFMDLIPSFFIMLFAVGFTFYQSAFVGTVLLLILPINTWVILMQLKSQRGVRVGLIRSQEEMHGTMIEMIAGVEETRTTHFENEQLKKVEVNADAICEREFNHHKGMVKFDFTKGMLKWIFHILILSTSIYMAYHNFITVGNVLTYSLLFMASIKPIEEIHRYLDELQENSIRANDLKEILEEYPLDISFSQDGNKRIEFSTFNANAIEISMLKFQYRNKESRNEILVLNDISLQIAYGEYVGIVGSSGCGKSSLIKNIMRLQIGNGIIQIGGKNIVSLSREEIAEQIVYIPQNPFIFNGTIRENLLFGCKRNNVSDEELKTAAKNACLLEYIDNLENRFETMITERGNNLSGGQRQRISLVRVFLNIEKPIIILDEATSAMDNTTEAKIYENLKATRRTIISIAHRLNTLVNADKIFVLESGKIVQEDTYANLIIQEGLFARLAAGHSEIISLNSQSCIVN